MLLLAPPSKSQPLSSAVASFWRDRGRPASVKKARPWIRKPPAASIEYCTVSAGRRVPRTRSFGDRAPESAVDSALPALSIAPTEMIRTVPFQVDGTLTVALQVPSVAVPEVRVSTGRSFD